MSENTRRISTEGGLKVKEDILIVGGYGAVGKHVVMELIKTCPEKIIIAGRNLEKAESFVKEVGQSLRVMQLDIYNDEQLSEKLATVHSVVMCLEVTNTNFVEACIDRGVNYIDISASSAIPSKLKQLESKAIRSGVTCILGVGIAPGLSTLLAKKITSVMDQVDQLNFTLMLGLGEQHGSDGVKWFLSNLVTDYQINDTTIKPFINRFQANLPAPLGVRKAYAFNLADQEIMSKTLSIPNVRTYFHYDSRLMTNLLHLLKRIGFFNLLKNSRIFNLFLKIFSSSLLSKGKSLTEAIVLHVKVTGRSRGKNLSYVGTIVGKSSSSLTGKISAFVASELNQNAYPTGVYYLNEVMDLDPISSYLNNQIHVEITQE